MGQLVQLGAAAAVGAAAAADAQQHEQWLQEMFGTPALTAIRLCAGAEVPMGSALSGAVIEAGLAVAEQRWRSAWVQRLQHELHNAPRGACEGRAAADERCNAEENRAVAAIFAGESFVLQVAVALLQRHMNNSSGRETR